MKAYYGMEEAVRVKSIFRLQDSNATVPSVSYNILCMAHIQPKTKHRETIFGPFFRQ